MKFSSLCFLLLAVCAFAAQVEITVLQTTDTHSSLTAEDRPGGKPNVLKLASLIKAEKAKDNEALLIDCGDCVQGSISSSITRGMAGLQPFLLLPYDVWVPGNHEMDYGVERFGDFCEAAGDKLLCGNLHIKGGRGYPAWRMIERKGARIAVIGMSASYYRHWLLAQDFAKIECTMAADALAKVLPEVVAAKPDAIVLAIHQAWFEGKDPRGVNEVNDIAARFPELDLILGGHSHRSIPGVRIGKKAWYVQAGAHAQSLAVVKMTLDTEAHKVTDIHSSLEVVNENTPEDGELKEKIKIYGDEAQAVLTADTGITLKRKISHQGKPGTTCQTSALIASAMAEASGADVAFHGKLYDISLGPGKVKAETFFWLVPYENRIVTFDATAEQLEKLMSEQWVHRNAYRFNGPWNMQFSINDGKAKLLKICGKEPEAGRKWRVAVNSHAAAGSGAFPFLQKWITLPEANAKVSDISTRQAVIQYLGKHQGNLTLEASWIVK